MAKTKTPFLSLGSTGSIGGSITTQKLHSETMVRAKPIPDNPRTLPQMYQRWLYEDYCYLWTKQTDTVKATYRVAGATKHLTAFQYWMKVMLSTMPDIAGMWHLDERSGAIAKDFSKHANDGIVYGATPAVGVIDYALSFDGLNDYVDFGSHSSLRPNAFSVEAFVKWHAGNTWVLVSFSGGALPIVAINWGGYSLIYLGGQNFRLFLHSPVNLLDGNWHHVAFRVVGNSQHDIDNAKCYADGQEQLVDSTNSIDVPTPKLGPFWSSRSAWGYVDGLIDALHLYTRPLDDNEAKRHSLRRYPL